MSNVTEIYSRIHSQYFADIVNCKRREDPTSLVTNIHDRNDGHGRPHQNFLAGERGVRRLWKIVTVGCSPTRVRNIIGNSCQKLTFEF
jgi:hypothetical protein